MTVGIALEDWSDERARIQLLDPCLECMQVIEQALPGYLDGDQRLIGESLAREPREEVFHVCIVALCLE